MSDPIDFSKLITAPTFGVEKLAALATPPMPHISKVNPAKWAYERLGKYIQAFEETLDESHEVGARLVSFGPSLVFHIESIGYHGPDIISFHGTNETGERIQLIQNVAQLNVVLVAMKKRHEKPRRIGFRLSEPDPAVGQKD